MGYLWDIYGSSMGHLHYDEDIMPKKQHSKITKK